jgi:hypothetical protein
MSAKGPLLRRDLGATVLAAFPSAAQAQGAAKGIEKPSEVDKGVSFFGNFSKSF